MLCDWGQDGSAIRVEGLRQIRRTVGLDPPLGRTVAAVDLQTVQF